MEEDILEDPKLYTAWKKDISHKIAQLTIFREKIPTVLKRCPKCKNLTLEFDSDKGRLYCTRCGFEEHVRM